MVAPSIWTVGKFVIGLGADPPCPVVDLVISLAIASLTRRDIDGDSTSNLSLGVLDGDVAAVGCSVM
jgi:hypothetical protein